MSQQDLPGILSIGDDLVGLVRDGVRRILPREKMSEEEAARVADEAAAAVRDDTWRYARALYDDRADARALAAETVRSGPAWTVALAALHRPAWSLATLALFVWIVVSPQLGLEPVPATDFVESVMQTVIVFYFGGRTAEKITATVKQPRL